MKYINKNNKKNNKKKKKNKKYAQTTIKNKNKQKKNKKEKIEMKDIIINMKPINYILNDKIDKKENNNIEKKFIKKINNKKEENIFDFNICKQKYEDDQDNSHIEIVFSNDNKTDQYNNFKGSLFNFNNLPQKEEKIITKNNNVSEKIIDIPNKIYRKSVLSKPFSEITKDLN